MNVIVEAGRPGLRVARSNWAAGSGSVMGHGDVKAWSHLATSSAILAHTAAHRGLRARVGGHRSGAVRLDARRCRRRTGVDRRSGHGHPRTFTSSVSALGSVKPRLAQRSALAPASRPRRAPARQYRRPRRQRAGHCGDRNRRARCGHRTAARRAHARGSQRAAVDRLDPKGCARAGRRYTVRSQGDARAEELSGSTRSSRRSSFRARADAARDRPRRRRRSSRRRAGRWKCASRASRTTQTDGRRRRARACRTPERSYRPILYGAAFADPRRRRIGFNAGRRDGRRGTQRAHFRNVIDLARLQVNAYIDEVDIGKIAPGQSVTFAVDAFPADDFTGRVAAIYPPPQSRTTSSSTSSRRPSRTTAPPSCGRR